MCVLQELTNKELIARDRDNPIVGYRGWYIINSFNDKPKAIKSLNINYIFSLGDATGNCQLDNLEGLYSYKNYYNYSYNYYNYNYSYNNYNYNNYNNNYNNYNNYYVAGKINHFGNIAEHKLGYRSSLGRINSLVKLTENLYKFNIKFIEHFNNCVEEVAKLYNAQVITQEEFESK